jgi:hypothetical protein
MYLASDSNFSRLEDISEISLSPHQQRLVKPTNRTVNDSATYLTAAMNMSEIIGSPHDVDLFDDIPKLEGKADWEVWKYQFYAALNTIHPIYSKIVFSNQQSPTQPTYLSTEPKSVICEAIKDRLGVGQTLEEHGHAITITKIAFKKKEVEMKATNLRLKNEYERKRDKWITVNQRAWIFIQVCIGNGPRALTKGTNDPRAAYLVLEERFAPPIWQSAFGSFKKLNDLCYDGKNPQDFVQSFQEALQYMTEYTGKVSPGLELCLFMKSILGHSIYEPVAWSPEAMNLDSVYVEFIRVETTN